MSVYSYQFYTGKIKTLTDFWLLGSWAIMSSSVSREEDASGPHGDGNDP